MNIAWGVMGYGRGHAMRTLSVLPSLARQHRITVFTAGDALPLLSPVAETVAIPMIGYRYRAGGGHSLLKTVAENLAPVGDLLSHGEGMKAVAAEFRRRKIDLVISDSEAWTHRAAKTLGIPRISFDHVGVLAYCRPHFPPDLWLAGMRDAMGYRALMGLPERILISSFYPAEGRVPGVKVVGPMLRDEAKALKPRRGDFLLAYFNKGEHQFRPHIQRALSLLDCPVRIYGTPYCGQHDNLDFRPPSNQQFLQDLAACRAVLSTAGNQLIGEAIHFGKPILALPEDAFEQRLNAHMIERMGVGMQASQRSLTPSDVDRFLAEEDFFRSHMQEHAGDGRTEAIATLQRYIDELSRPAVASLRPAGLKVPGALALADSRPG